MSELVTLDEIKHHFGMTGSNADVDDELESISDRISKIFETYCDRTFDSDTYIEYYDGGGRDMLVLKHYPIISITSIYDDSDWGWGASYLVDSDNYMIKNDREVVYKSGYVFYDYIQNVKVTYVAGYATIPDDLKHVCILEVLRSYKHRKDVDITSKSLEDGSVTYTSKEFLPMTLAVLNKYTRRSIS